MNLKQYVLPPTYADEEKNLQARALHSLLLYVIFISVVIGGLSVIFIFPVKAISGLTILVGLIIIAFLFYLNHHGQVVPAARIFFLTFWFLTTFLVVVSQGMRSLDIIF
jgi:hypothetical protein